MCCSSVHVALKIWRRTTIMSKVYIWPRRHPTLSWAVKNMKLHSELNKKQAFNTGGQSYKASTIINYDSIAVTLEHF